MQIKFCLTGGFMRWKSLAAFVLAAAALSACAQYNGQQVATSTAKSPSVFTSSSSPKKRIPLDRSSQTASMGPMEIYSQKISCVPYARTVSGIELKGDAWRWWDAAKNVYQRGTMPQVGSVIVMKKSKSLNRGHVGVVTRILGDREVQIDHANWRRGEVHRGALVRDVSKDNDWSLVEVWYPPIGDFGSTRYAVSGFIYPRKLEVQTVAAEP